MPTKRARLVITESDDLARILDEAAVRWPDEGGNRARLLKRLARRGAEALRDDVAADRRRWSAVVNAAAGAAGPEAYPPDYLETLRGDWPA